MRRLVSKTIFLLANRILVALCAIGTILVAPSPAQTINTVAGDRVQGYSGDGGPATEAELGGPYGVAADTAGNFYIVDQPNCLVRKVTVSSGVISRVAGSLSSGSAGNCGFAGDGGPATSATLNTGYAIAADSSGNLYLTDLVDCVIRKVTAATGIITTVAGRQSLGCGFSGDGGPATSAQLGPPFGVALDASGNVYVGDADNTRVRKITASTGNISTIAGGGAGCPGETDSVGDGCPATSAALLRPYGVAVDSSGNIYIADEAGARVRKVTASSGIISTVAGTGTMGYTGDGGPATSADLGSPVAIAVDAGGDFSLADVANNVIRLVTASTGIIATTAGDGSAGFGGDGGPATMAELNSPHGVALNASGDIYIGDTSNVVIREVTAPARIASTVSLVSSANPSMVGESVIFTATVAPSGPPTPTGTVNFTANGSTISGCLAVALSSSRTAMCTTSTLAGGTDAIAATYSGDANYAGSTGTVSQVVNKNASTTALTSSMNPSMAGQAVTFTAAITPHGPPVPTGVVAFTANGTSIAGCSAVAVSTAAAACLTATLAVGTNAIIATYSGDSNYTGSMGSLAQVVTPATALQFVPMAPCRIVDTRNADGPFGGPAISGESFRSFALPASTACPGIPATAAAYSLNVTAVPETVLNYLTIWPEGETKPSVSLMNSPDGRVKANAAIVPAGGAGGSVSVYVTNTSNVVLDINGYFATSNSSSLEFFPLTPCRAVDTRNANGTFGGPILSADTERDFPLAGACDIPSSGAVAYSLNFTAIPPTGGILEYLTVWPTGVARPMVSTLNDPTGTIVANAAIVPAGTSGKVAVYPSNQTNLTIDVNGYFALATSGPNGLSLYTEAPCRVLDTRTVGSGSGFIDGLTVAVETSSACPQSSMAKAYVFNATVIPPEALGFLTLWPDGETRPTVSTLNAPDAAIASNMAIVPTNNGSIDAYADDKTELLLDISAYFAP